MATEQIILGLDPGTATTGYGVIGVSGDKLRHIAHGVIATKAGGEPSARLLDIATQLEQVIAEFKPDTVVIEELFFFKNVTTAMSVAQARGVLMVTCARLHVPMKSFTPLQMKKAMTGFGTADKTQIQKMVKLILGLPEIPKPDDAADGLALAITGATSLTLHDR